MINTQEKIRKMLDKHTEYRPDFVSQLTSAEKSLQEAIITKKFGDNDIMKKIRQLHARYIHEINEILLYAEDLSVEKRNRLLDKRKMYIDFLQLFSTAQLTIKNIGDWIDQEFD